MKSVCLLILTIVASSSCFLILPHNGHSHQKHHVPEETVNRPARAADANSNDLTGKFYDLASLFAGIIIDVAQNVKHQNIPKGSEDLKPKIDDSPFERVNNNRVQVTSNIGVQKVVVNNKAEDKFNEAKPVIVENVSANLISSLPLEEVEANASVNVRARQNDISQPDSPYISTLLNKDIVPKAVVRSDDQQIQDPLGRKKREVPNEKLKIPAKHNPSDIKKKPNKESHIKVNNPSGLEKREVANKKSQIQAKQNSLNKKKIEVPNKNVKIQAKENPSGIEKREVHNKQLKKNHREGSHENHKEKILSHHKTLDKKHEIGHEKHNVEKREIGQAKENHKEKIHSHHKTLDKKHEREHEKHNVEKRNVLPILHRPEKKRHNVDSIKENRDILHKHAKDNVDHHKEKRQILPKDIIQALPTLLPLDKKKLIFDFVKVKREIGQAKENPSGIEKREVYNKQLKKNHREGSHENHKEKILSHHKTLDKKHEIGHEKHNVEKREIGQAKENHKEKIQSHHKTLDKKHEREHEKHNLEKRNMLPMLHHPKSKRHDVDSVKGKGDIMLKTVKDNAAHHIDKREALQVLHGQEKKKQNHDSVKEKRDTLLKHVKYNAGDHKDKKELLHKDKRESLPVLLRPEPKGHNVDFVKDKRPIGLKPEKDNVGHHKEKKQSLHKRDVLPVLHVPERKRHNIDAVKEKREIELKPAKDIDHYKDKREILPVLHRPQKIRHNVDFIKEKEDIGLKPIKNHVRENRGIGLKPVRDTDHKAKREVVPIPLYERKVDKIIAGQPAATNCKEKRQALGKKKNRRVHRFGPVPDIPADSNKFHIGFANNEALL